MAWPAEQEKQWQIFLAGLEASSRGFFLLEYDRLDTHDALLRRLRAEFERRQWQLDETRLSDVHLETRLTSTLREWPIKAGVVLLDGATTQQFNALNLAREALYDLPTNIVFLTSQETHSRFLTSARDLVTWINIPFSFALPKTVVPQLPDPSPDVSFTIADRIQYYREQVHRAIEQDNQQESFRLLPPLADLYLDAKMYNAAYQIYQALSTYQEQSADERQAILYVRRRDTTQGWRILADLAIPDKHYIPLPEDLALLKKQLDEGMLSIQKMPDSPASSTPSTQPDSILIVTVIKVEAQAVLDVFSQAAGKGWTREITGNKTYYNLGVHGGAPVFMVQSEMGTATPGGALSTVRQAIQDLRPQAVILCGVTFGLHPDKQKLGDILVARQLGYYEPQKVDVQRGQMQRGDRVTASVRLLDRFRSGDIDWEGPKTHFGLVLSGEKLVNDSAFRDWLLRVEPEAIGGEMEGAGLYVAAREAQVDWILVKAICDWADGSKHDNAQPLAARNAAQFVLHVLKLGGLSQSEQLHGFVVLDERGHAMPISRPLLATLAALSERVATEVVRVPEEKIGRIDSRVRLRQALTDHFSDSELRTLCVVLGMDYESLPGESKADKAREVVAYLERRGRIPELVAIASRLRPNVSWQDAPEVIGKVFSPDELTSLRQDIVSYLSDDELHDLCTNMGLDDARPELAAPRKADKVRKLVAYLEHRNRIPELVKALAKQRPDVSWDGPSIGAGDKVTIGENVSVKLAPANTSDSKALQRALTMARRTLAILEEQAAGYTALTIPVYLRIELEEKRRQVTDLETQLQSL